MNAVLRGLDQPLKQAEQLAAEFSLSVAHDAEQISTLQTIEGLIQEVETHTTFKTALATQDAELARAANEALERVSKVRATIRSARTALLNGPAFQKNRDWAPYEKWRQRAIRQTPRSLDSSTSRHYLDLQSLEQNLKTARVQCLGLEANGETIQALKSNLTSFDANLREGSYKRLITILNERRDLHATLFDSFLTCRIAQADALGFSTPEERRHAQNNIDAEHVDALATALASTQTSNAQQFYRNKADWMGSKTLNYWDRAAPLAVPEAHSISFEDAHDFILEAFAGIHPEYLDIARKFFSNGWIDALPRPGKAEGGFCLPGSPNTPPRIVLNYRGSVRCVLELAHELGHAVHYWYARQSGPLRAPTPFPIAEAAAIFAEQITFLAMLGSESDEDAKTQLMRSRQQDFINTCYRQNALHQFERAVYAQKASGSLSADWLEETFAEHEAALIGPNVLPQRDFGGLYFLVPHFFEYPFYMYAYPFGELTACLLARDSQANPDTFYARFKTLMSLGGDCHLSDIEALFDIDLTQENTWREAIQAFHAAPT